MDGLYNLQNSRLIVYSYSNLITKSIHYYSATRMFVDGALKSENFKFQMKQHNLQME